jgi:conjugal transfer pilus assembly protein TrbC
MSCPGFGRSTRVRVLGVAVTSALLFLPSSPALAQQAREAGSLAAEMRSGWQAYIFVSSRMPRRSLVELTREASLADAVLVLRGFDIREGEPVDLVATQRWIAGLQAECCGAPSRRANAVDPGRGVPKTARWVVDPRLFERFHVQAAPTFVLAWPGADPQRDAARVEGDMALANALKFFAQRSRNQSIRAAAAQLYAKSYGGSQ